MTRQRSLFANLTALALLLATAFIVAPCISAAQDQAAPSVPQTMVAEPSALPAAAAPAPTVFPVQPVFEAITPATACPGSTSCRVKEGSSTICDNWCAPGAGYCWNYCCFCLT